ncbi:helix-turn-helix domain-containing protein [Streptomyces sioyaensis]|uniref:helix-turn-helix domain-containing protein n=1 Tax=Streptomyces sioyaensis TaxID=67364 RepID=UPI0037D53F8B
MTADATPTRAQKFAALVVPAAHAAGFTGHGANASLARAAGITESSVSRMLTGRAIPDVRCFEDLAAALKIPVRDLLVQAEIISAHALTETDRSQVRSPVSLEAAADALGIADDPIARQMFYGVVERLRKEETAPDGERDDQTGGAAAEQ